MSKWLAVCKAALPLLVLGGCFLLARQLVKERPEPDHKPRDERGTLVEVTTVHAGAHDTVVEVQGTVVAAYEVDLAAEITGRVIWKNPSLTTGGLVRAGDPLIKLDARDYKIALSQQQAAVERARTEMELELGRKAVAEREWKMFGAETRGSIKLATREPQLKSVELGLKSAESGRDQAKLRLDRTTVRAPFNAVVRENSVEMGSMVSPGSPLAKLVDTDVFMVVASLPVEDLAWLRVPGVNASPLSDDALDRAYESDDPRAALSEITTFVRVRQKVGGGHIERFGFVTRLIGDLDPVGRMARLLVAIVDPMGLEVEEKPDGVAGLPLLLGAYVSAELHGKALLDAFEVPRLALRDGDNVYVAGDDDKLEIRPVEVARRRAESVLVTAGLHDGDRVITSVVPSALPGMDLRVLSGREPDAGGVKTAKLPAEGTPEEALQ